MAPRTSRKAKRSRRHTKRSARKRGLLRGLLFRTLIVGALAGLAYVVYLDIRIRVEFEGKRWALPAQVYARALELYPGMALGPERFALELKALGYRHTRFPDAAGTFLRDGARFDLATRGFAFWDGQEPARRVRLAFAGNRLVEIRDAGNGAALKLLRLDPPLIGKIYPAHNEDRILVRLDEVPEALLQALIAVEDRNYYQHFGIDVRAIARAVLANLRAGGAVQGGSTLTQQLVKNFFLSNERTLWRKANEAVMALLLEWHYDKREILEAYLNEVYLGQDGKHAVHGFGLASRFYFGQSLDSLKLPQLALLVGLVRGASYYDPRRHPERARKRRDLVLDLLAQQGGISPARARVAQAAPLGVTQTAPSGLTLYPAFMDLVRRQLRRDYREDDLTSEGLQIFTTLEPRVQRQAERAVAGRIQRLEADLDLPRGKLEGAAVVTGRDSGEVLAVVGGRNARFAGFNRALDAVRQVGSVIKPAVYLTALAQPERYTLISALQDAPLTLERPDGSVWSPKNYDHESHGAVPLHTALANSYNLATARLGLDLGADAVARTLRRLGVRREFHHYPSLFLGTVALPPIEVVQMYQTLAAGGFHTPLRAIREVLDVNGRPLSRYPLSVEQTVDPTAVYLLNTALQEAVRAGTGRPLQRQLPASLAVAGKTGTTDDLRDSWFAGFTGNYLGVVWLGMDDNTPARLSGASGALGVWGDIMGPLDPEPLQLVPPPGVEWLWIDPATGLRGDASCPGAVQLPFIAGSAPARFAPCAGGGLRDAVEGTLDWFRKVLP